ncbi:leucine-rich repeat protein [Ruminococcus sp.]
MISIGNKAFAGCTALENITIPNGVTSVGCDASCGF